MTLNEKYYSVQFYQRKLVGVRIMTPIEVVEAYNYELWNKQNYASGENIIADQVVRHSAGSVTILSREESIQRVRDA